MDAPIVTSNNPIHIKQSGKIDRKSLLPIYDENDCFANYQSRLEINCNNEAENNANSRLFAKHDDISIETAMNFEFEYDNYDADNNNSNNDHSTNNKINNNSNSNDNSHNSNKTKSNDNSSNLIDLMNDENDKENTNSSKDNSKSVAIQRWRETYSKHGTVVNEPYFMKNGKKNKNNSNSNNDNDNNDNNNDKSIKDDNDKLCWFGGTSVDTKEAAMDTILFNDKEFDCNEWRVGDYGKIVRKIELNGKTGADTTSIGWLSPNRCTFTNSGRYQKQYDTRFGGSKFVPLLPDVSNVKVVKIVPNLEASGLSPYEYRYEYFRQTGEMPNDLNKAWIVFEFIDSNIKLYRRDRNGISTQAEAFQVSRKMINKYDSHFQLVRTKCGPDSQLNELLFKIDYEPEVHTISQFLMSILPQINWLIAYEISQFCAQKWQRDVYLDCQYFEKMIKHRWFKYINKYGHQYGSRNNDNNNKNKRNNSDNDADNPIVTNRSIRKIGKRMKWTQLEKVYKNQIEQTAIRSQPIFPTSYQCHQLYARNPCVPQVSKDSNKQLSFFS